MRDAGPPLSETRVRPPTREFRAMWTFIVSVVVAVVILVLYSGLIPLFASSVGLLLGPILMVVVHALAAAGLSSRTPAARYAMAPLLWILIVMGLITVVVSLLRATIHVPVGAILAWWALRAPPDPALGPVRISSGGGTLLVAGAIVSAIVSLLAGF